MVALIERADRRLPIDQNEAEVMTSIGKNRLTVVRGATGCGKTRRIAAWCFKAGYTTIHTLPRRLTARAAAIRAAKDTTSVLGVEVGFRTSMERSYGPRTRLMFATDGLRVIQELFGLGDPDVLILDEVHEWHLETEVLMALVRERMMRNPKLRLVIMSATIEPHTIAQYFGFPDCAVVEIATPEPNVVEQPPGRSILEDVIRLLKEDRNVLCFLPGKREIERMIADIRRSGVPCVALPLHAELQPAEQDRVFVRKTLPQVVFSTIVGQNSVSGDFDAVVDCGLERTSELGDDRVELLSLRIVSLADRRQRMGRADRGERRGPPGPAVYIDHCPCPLQDRPQYAAPEIHRVDLAQAYLRIACVGLDMRRQKYYHQPKARDIAAAREQLVQLGCLTPDGRVTKIGERVARLPVKVNYGRMLVEAERLGVIDVMIGIVAAAETKGLGDRRNTRWKMLCRNERDSDAFAQRALLVAASHMSPAMRTINGINPVAYDRAAQIQKRLRYEFKGALRRQQREDRQAVIRAMCTGMVGNLFRRVVNKNRKKGGKCYTNGVRVRRLSHNSILSEAPEWIIGEPRDIQLLAEGRKRKKRKVTHRLISLATRIDPVEYERAVPHLVRRYERARVRYSAARDVVASQSRTEIGTVAIETRWRRDPGHPEAPLAFAAWLATATLSGTQPSNDRLAAVLKHNRDVLRRCSVLNVRAEAPTFLEMTEEELTAWYAERLEGARAVREIREPDVLRLPEPDEARVGAVLRDLPETVTLGRLQLAVDYAAGPLPVARLELGSHEGLSEVNGNLNGAARLCLPSGEVVQVQLTFDGQLRYDGTSLQELGRTLRRLLTTPESNGHSRVPDSDDGAELRAPRHSRRRAERRSGGSRGDDNRWGDRY